MFAFVCMYVCMYICMHVCECVCVYARIYACKCMCIHVYINISSRSAAGGGAWMHVYIWCTRCMYTTTSTTILQAIHLYISTHTITYKHTYTSKVLQGMLQQWGIHMRMSICIYVYSWICKCIHGAAGGVAVVAVVEQEIAGALVHGPACTPQRPPAANFANVPATCMSMRQYAFIHVCVYTRTHTHQSIRKMT